MVGLVLNVSILGGRRADNRGRCRHYDQGAFGDAVNHASSTVHCLSAFSVRAIAVVAGQKLALMSEL